MGKRVWTKEKIIEELKLWRRKGTTFNSKLYGAARVHFGSLGNALKIAGLPCGNSAPHKQWSKQIVIDAIRARYHERQYLEGVCYDDRSLYEASKRYFGDWTQACAAAGFPRIPKELYTADEVLVKIIELYEREQPLTFCLQKDVIFKRSVRKHFGGWRNAVLSLGLEGELSRTWTKQRVIDAIKGRVASGLDLSKTGRQDPGLFGAAVKHFGSWFKALESLGIEQQAREFWTEEKVIARLKYYSQTRPGVSIHKIDSSLVSAAIKRFGTISKAMEAAGALPLMRRWSKSRVIVEIQSRYAMGEPMDPNGPGKTPLGLAANKYFGSWAQAVEAAGLSAQIPTYKPPRRWSADDVLTAIRQEYDSCKPISKIAKQVKGLETAAIMHFGKLSLAVEAAGLEMRNRRWTQASVIAEIRKRFKDGQSLSSNERNNASLFYAATRYCGSWPSALKMAGVPAIPKGRRKRT